MQSPTELPRHYKIRKEDEPTYATVRAQALEILEPYQKTFSNPEAWRITIDECYTLDVYSSNPFTQRDIEMFLKCCNFLYTFQIIQSQFQKYIVRARFHLRL